MPPPPHVIKAKAMPMENSDKTIKKSKEANSDSGPVEEATSTAGYQEWCWDEEWHDNNDYGYGYGYGYYEKYGDEGWDWQDYPDWWGRKDEADEWWLSGWGDKWQDLTQDPHASEAEACAREEKKQDVVSAPAAAAKKEEDPMPEKPPAPVVDGDKAKWPDNPSGSDGEVHWYANLYSESRRGNFKKVEQLEEIKVEE